MIRINTSLPIDLPQHNSPILSSGRQNMQSSPHELITSLPDSEAKLLGDCYALLLADIRRNRRRRLAQQAEATAVESQAAEIKNSNLPGATFQ